MSLYELLFGFTATTKAKHPDCFRDGTIDRTKCHRIVPMEVLSLGMSRTGTASMHAAFEQLGYPSYHGFQLFSSAPDCDMWAEAYELKYFQDRSGDLNKEFFDKILGHVSAVTDTPAVSFATELIRAYPDAKVVLVEREIEGWCQSFAQIFCDAYDNRLAALIARLDTSYLGKHRNILVRGLAEGQFHAHNGKEFRANLKEVYEDHYAEIRETLKHQPERLLEYRLGQGWGPLCEFLGKPVPDVPFPRVNESEAMQGMVRVLLLVGVRKMAIRWAPYALPLRIAVVFLWKS